MNAPALALEQIPCVSCNYRFGDGYLPATTVLVLKCPKCKAFLNLKR